MSIPISNPLPRLTGVSLMHGETRLASVRHVEPDEVHPGCVHLQVWTENPDALLEGTGSMQVHDTNQDAIYLVQALRCRATDQGYELMVTTLGECRGGQGEGSVEDYLVVEGCDPVLIQQLAIADAACTRGPHVRCEIEAEAWSSLPVRSQTPRACVCGGPVGSRKRDKASEGLEHRWSFLEIRPRAEFPLRSGIVAEIVRLGSRATHRVNLHLALPGDPSRPVVSIGHIIATEHWAP
ncbi:MAG: hypothetical protein AAGG38_14795 [Planctomycetota bacterium]